MKKRLAQFFLNLSKPTTSNVFRLVVLGFLAQVFLSWKLWDTSNRTFPQVPILFFETGFPNFGVFPALVLVGLLAAVFVFPLKKRLVFTLVFWLGGMIFLDLTRLQVWVWFYFLVILIVLNDFFSKKLPNPNPTKLSFRRNLPKIETKSSIQTGADSYGMTTLGNLENHIFFDLRWLLAAVYFWGGFNKLNPYFFEDIFPWLCEASERLHFFSDKKWAAVSVAVFEMMLAPGLLFQKTRRVFGWLAVAFHLANVLMLSPLGLNWNEVVIPWNLAMAVLVFWVSGKNDSHFLHTEPSKFTKVLNFRKPDLTILAFAWLAPLLNVFGGWPENLSWKMYAGTHPECTFIFDKSLKINAPQLVLEKTIEGKENNLTLDDWAIGELGTPPFSTEFALKKAGKTLCKRYGNSEKTGFWILTTTPWKKGAEKVEQFDCKFGQ